MTSDELILSLFKELRDAHEKNKTGEEEI